MKKAPFYSRSRQRTGSPAPSEESARTRESLLAAPSPSPESAAAPSPRWRGMPARRRKAAWALAAAMLLVLGGLMHEAMVAPPPAVTQRDIDQAVRHTLEKSVLPSPYARTYAAIIPSVVRVMGLDDEKDDPKAAGDDPRKHTRSTGTGVVIIDNGTILTNLHVVSGSKRIHVTFFDGTDSDASVVAAQPENDLAVLRAHRIPDDLKAATMRGTGDLIPGDQVLAVGFPFGIGPSASGGVISGLKRSFRSPDGDRLTNLIQFDAAANPGNSGGPLVTMDGAVVGIVTAILNPGEQGTFIGIGFAMPIENAAAAAGMPPF
jgi:S1-C subfamily serine protease